ncbi:hypothetical protein UA45_18195 [Morganella morganii]|uniref:Uncharacterized protein n=1 Tax=Morganella morganii TaxID=582 RepID=A0A0D8L6T2_MORMO|nr:hypothetical protein UA45_18195 [Morganella morganii]
MILIKSKWIILVFSLFILSMNINKSLANESDNNGVKVASDLIMKLTFADSIDKKNEILNEIKKIKEENKTDMNVANIYISGLVGEKQYDLALSEINEISNDDKEGRFLLKCMLMDRLEKKEVADCYTSYIETKNKKKEKDIDYIMALYLSGSPKYQTEKEEYIKNSKFADDLQPLDTKSKRDVLSELFP